MAPIGEHPALLPAHLEAAQQMGVEPAKQPFDPGPTLRTPAGRPLIEVDERVPKDMIVVLDGQARLEAELRAKMIVAEENARDAREAYERAVQRRQSSSPSH